MTKINSETQAHDAIASWRQDPLLAQQKKVRSAIESLELSEMYYEQKGNDKGAARARCCIAILESRQTELEAEKGHAPDKHKG